MTPEQYREMKKGKNRAYEEKKRRNRRTREIRQVVALNNIRKEEEK